MWILRLHLNLCPLEFFWMQKAKDSIQAELNNKWGFSVLIFNNCVGVEARFNQGIHTARNNSWNLPSFVLQFCPQVGFTRWLLTSAGATGSSFTSKMREEIGFPQPLNKENFMC